MGNDAYQNILNKEIQLLEYADGVVTFSDIENMYLEELEYFIHNYKIIYENKDKNKQERLKAIFEFVGRMTEQLFKLLSRLGGQK